MEKKLPRILLACPQSDKKSYCWNEWTENVLSLSYPNFDILLVDNSDKNDFSKRIKKQGIHCHWIKPYGKSEIEKIALSHEAIRVYALQNNYDYLFHLESDVFPDPFIIESLLTCKKSVVGATYHIGQGKNSQLMIQVIEHYENEHFIDTRMIGAQATTFLDGQVKKCFSVGLGCILIHKSVFPHFQFRYEKGKNFHPDSFFAHDLFRKGIDIHCDTSLLCKHQNVARGFFSVDFKA